MSANYSRFSENKQTNKLRLKQVLPPHLLKLEVQFPLEKYHYCPCVNMILSK